MKKFVALTTLFVLALVSVSFAEITLKGKVTDAKTGKALVGANVRLVGTSIGTATNNRGEFTLNRIPDGSYTLRASYSGYEVSSMKINSSKSDIIFRLEVTPINLDQVVVSGTGTHRKLKDSPVPVEVMTASDIKKSGISTIEDALVMLNPSFSFRPTAMGTNMTLNGMKGEYILILVNGKKMMGDISGYVDLSRVDMGKVKRIEVLKGAASSLYGSDAIAGVINIITDQPHDALNIASTTRFGGKGSFIENINADINTGKFSSSTSYQRRQSNGWKLSNITEDSVYTRRQVSDKFHSDIVTQRFAYDPSKSLNLYVEGNYFTKKLDRPVNKDADDKSGFDYNMEYENYGIGLGGKYLFGNSAYISLDINANNYEYSKVYTRTVIEKNDTTALAGEDILTKRQRYLSANLKGVFKVGKYNKFSVGTEYVNDYLKNPTDLTESKNAYTLALYAQDEIRIFKKLQLVPGFRYLYHETFKNKITPKLAAMYSLGDFNFRLSYAAGFKAPLLTDLYYYKESAKKGKLTIVIGNPDLKPEKSNYYAFNTEYAGKYLNISVNGYINDLRDVIETKKLELTAEDEANKVTSRSTYENLDKARTQGIDISVNSYLGAGFSVGGGYSYVDARDRKTKIRLEESIRHSGSMRVNYMHEWDNYRLNVNLNGRLQGKKFVKVDEIDAPKYQIWNLTTNHSFAPVGMFIFEVNAGIENLFDYSQNLPYGSNLGTLSPGRSFFASLTIKFKK
ncbi:MULTISPECIES: TonB-dependent receptor [Butyricimonas]|uniref:TonB-dependent receptor n=1 Tax=Butyricimonas TaxID=574697 RepID=UPI00036A9BC5|nr:MULTISPECIES: TonB-dependent receptor [Butyricimonas]